MCAYISVTVPVCAHMFMRHCVYDTNADINDACHQSVQWRARGKAWLKVGRGKGGAVEESAVRGSRGGESNGP